MPVSCSETGPASLRDTPFEEFGHGRRRDVQGVQAGSEETTQHPLPREACLVLSAPTHHRAQSRHDRELVGVPSVHRAMTGVASCYHHQVTSDDV